MYRCPQMHHMQAVTKLLIWKEDSDENSLSVYVYGFDCACSKRGCVK